MLLAFGFWLLAFGFLAFWLFGETGHMLNKCTPTWLTHYGL